MAAKKSAAKTETATKKKTAAPKNPFKGDSKLAKFLTDKKLDPRRVLAVSHTLETLTRADRDLKLARRKAKSGEGGDEKKEAPKGKPRSGRPVTHRAMQAAMAGGALSGPTKSRILRAVNHLLEQKKHDKVDLRVLF